MTYAQQIAQVTNHALEAGVPLPEIIQALEMVKLELAVALMPREEATKCEIQTPALILPGQ